MIIPIPRSRRAWLALRQNYVGGSEVAALFGLAPDSRPSAFTMHHVKRGITPPPSFDNERAGWGTALEPAIARRAAKLNKWKIKRGGFAIDEQCSGSATTLDYSIIEGGPQFGPGILEIKVVDYLVWRDEWRRGDGDQVGEPPAHVALQAQDQMAATGYTWGYVAALVGGNDLKLYPVFRDEAVITEIRAAKDAFWDGVAAQTPPPVDGGSTTRATLRLLYPVTREYEVEVDVSHVADFADTCKRWNEAATERLRLQKVEDLEKNRIIYLMGDARRIAGNGYRATLSVTPATEGRSEVRRYAAKPIPLHDDDAPKAKRVKRVAAPVAEAA